MRKCLANSKQVQKARSSTVHTLADDDSNADLISPSTPCFKMLNGCPLFLGQLPKSLSMGDSYQWFGPRGPPWHPLPCLPLWPGLSFSFLPWLVSFRPKWLFSVSSDSLHLGRLFKVPLVLQPQLQQHFFREGVLRTGALVWFRIFALHCTHCTGICKCQSPYVTACLNLCVSCWTANFMRAEMVSVLFPW